jgi:SAM-dependent methyltransferase
MDANTSGQVIRSAAEIYERRFVPSLCHQWTAKLVDAAGIRYGSLVADIACGTGVLARAAANRAGLAELVVGVDPNESMLAVAKRTAPGIRWQLACAESLPFADESFDAVVCQFGLMFFDDKPRGIREMMRILRPGGRLVVAVWDSLERNAGFSAAINLLQRTCSGEFADGMRVPFALGDVNVLRALFRRAGVRKIAVSTHVGQARYASVRAWIYTIIKGWTLAPSIDGNQFARLLDAADRELAPFAAPDGVVAFNAPAHLIVAQRS